MTDTQVTEWISPGAKQIAAGGSLGIVACLLLLVFAEGWCAQLRWWGLPEWGARLAEASVSITAATIGVGAILQVVAGLSALPSENTAEPSLAATLVNLYGALAVSGWILLLPAASAGLFATRRRPRWALAVSAVASVTLTLAIALPVVSWGPAAAWLIALGVGCLLTEDVGRQSR